MIYLPIQVMDIITGGIEILLGIEGLNILIVATNCYIHIRSISKISWSGCDVDLPVVTVANIGKLASRILIIYSLGIELQLSP